MPWSSEAEEGSLLVPLEMDVEVEATVAGGPGDERGPGRVAGQGGEDRIGGVRLRLVAEVDARRQAVQQPARVDQHREVGRAAARGRLGRADAPAAVLTGRGAG